MHATILLGDPISRNYGLLIKRIIGLFDSREKGINIIFNSHIRDSEVLNILLARYYSLTRKEVEDASFDYRFEINIFFNVSDLKKIIDSNKKIYKLSDEDIPVIEGKVVEIRVDLTEDGHGHMPNLVENRNDYLSSGIVAVGGTFDHIHDGHKILLSMAIFLAKQKLIVGITGSKLLVNKKFASVLDSFEVRLESLLKFIKSLLSKSVMFEIYEINDICGPTGFIENINTLVVSEESIKGAEFVNNYRLETGFPALDVVKIRVIGDEDSNETNSWKGKLSSTDIREKEYKRLKC